MRRIREPLRRWATDRASVLGVVRVRGGRHPRRAWLHTRSHRRWRAFLTRWPGDDLRSVYLIRDGVPIASGPAPDHPDSHR